MKKKQTKKNQIPYMGFNIDNWGVIVSIFEDKAFFCKIELRILILLVEECGSCKSKRYIAKKLKDNYGRVVSVIKELEKKELVYCTKIGNKCSVNISDKLRLKGKQLIYEVLEENEN